MRAWLGRHVAWRYRSTDKARRIFLGFDVMKRRAEAIAEGLCSACHGPREDPDFRQCRRCRRLKAKQAKDRMAAKNAIGLCGRCPNDLDRDGTLCCACVDKIVQRKRRGQAETNQPEG